MSVSFSCRPVYRRFSPPPTSFGGGLLGRGHLDEPDAKPTPSLPDRTWPSVLRGCLSCPGTVTVDRPSTNHAAVRRRFGQPARRVIQRTGGADCKSDSGAIRRVQMSCYRAEEPRSPGRALVGIVVRLLRMPGNGGGDQLNKVGSAFYQAERTFSQRRCPYRSETAVSTNWLKHEGRYNYWRSLQPSQKRVRQDLERPRQKNTHTGGRIVTYIATGNCSGCQRWHHARLG